MKLSKNIGALASAAIIVASLSACSTAGKLKDGVTDTAGKVMEGDGDSMLADKSEMLDSQAAALEARSAELDKREAMLAQKTSAPAGGSAGANYGAGDLLPPGAKPGQCFTRLWVAPQYDTVSERILVEEASERVEIIPALSLIHI